MKCSNNNVIIYLHLCVVVFQFLGTGALFWSRAAGHRACPRGLPPHSSRRPSSRQRCRRMCASQGLKECRLPVSDRACPARVASILALVALHRACHLAQLRRQRAVCRSQVLQPGGQVGGDRPPARPELPHRAVIAAEPTRQLPQRPSYVVQALAEPGGRHRHRCEPCRPRRRAATSKARMGQARTQDPPGDRNRMVRRDHAHLPSNGSARPQKRKGGDRSPPLPCRARRHP